MAKLWQTKLKPVVKKQQSPKKLKLLKLLLKLN
jgi:hypothetical protein